MMHEGLAVMCICFEIVPSITWCIAMKTYHMMELQFGFKTNSPHNNRTRVLCFFWLIHAWCGPIGLIDVCNNSQRFIHCCAVPAGLSIRHFWRGQLAGMDTEGLQYQSISKECSQTLQTWGLWISAYYCNEKSPMFFFTQVVISAVNVKGIK